MLQQSLYQTFQRYRTLNTHKITALPLAILMPHSACNCRCVMCDIWKSNNNLRQLNEDDVVGLLGTFKELGTKRVLMTGGEALLNPNFFRFCEILKKQGIKITLLSTGLTIKKHAHEIVALVDDVIVSLDGNESTHDLVRNIPGAFKKMEEGIRALHSIDPYYKVTGRTVIHRLNFQQWPEIIDAAKRISLKQVSFLPADVSSHAFNREILWGMDRKNEILIAEDDLPGLQKVIEKVITGYEKDFESMFIAESPEKIQKIYGYYAAFYGLNPFPYKKCNAPWVSAVVEADGTVRPCFFHEKIGNIRTTPFDDILNSRQAIDFRKNLDIEKNETCMKCVCYLNLPAHSVI